MKYSWQGTLVTIVLAVLLAITYSGNNFSPEIRAVLVAIVGCTILLIMAIRLE